MDIETCQQCKQLKQASEDAYKYWVNYRPMHTGYRPQSRWFTADRQEKSRAHDAYQLAKARYELHRAEHIGQLTDAKAREAARNVSIVLRGGRLQA